jgi:hypothetical protein
MAKWHIVFINCINIYIYHLFYTTMQDDNLSHGFKLSCAVEMWLSCELLYCGKILIKIANISKFFIMRLQLRLRKET